MIYYFSFKKEWQLENEISALTVLPLIWSLETGSKYWQFLVPGTVLPKLYYSKHLRILIFSSFFILKNLIPLIAV